LAGERQEHGFRFEDWLKKTFFDIYYTSEWDIPKELNPNKRGGPISIKTAKWKSSIYFGDALRQFDINEDWTLIVGFWKNQGKKKKIVKITESLITKENWRGYWGSITRAEIARLDTLIKNRRKSYNVIRKEAQACKSMLKQKSNLITLNPKIDSKAQRRLQCSIPFTKFFEHIIQEPEPEEDGEFFLWGQKITPPSL